MKNLLAFLFGITILSISCASDSTDQNSASNNLSAIEVKEVVKLDSLSNDLDKTSEEIEQKMNELEDALKDLE